MTSLEREAKIGEKIVETIATTFVGKRTIIRKMLAGSLANGHILFEDYPGLGKTLLVKAFARSIGVNFNRAQFTPDVLPSDILGTKIWDQKTSNFKLSKGPIFTNILLADEINRSPPKTQSALLEAMEERQVTIEGETLKLEPPFFVLATQNPIEQEGSLDLDETVLLDGRLQTGRELLARAPAKKAKGIELHDVQGTTFALDTGGDLTPDAATLYSLPYGDDYVKLRTRTGREIKVTKNHPFLVNDNGIIRWKKAGELTTQDYLVQPAKLPALPAATFPSHSDTIAKMEQKPIPREIVVDDDFAFWIAFILADGSVGDKAIEAVQRNYPDALDRWIEISRSYGFRPAVRVKAGVRHARFYSKPMVEYLRLRFGIQSGRAKEIPTAFLGLEAGLNRTFLRTFIGLESSLRDNRIVFTQKSRTNTNLIAQMLLREGILSWARHDGRVWRLKIQGADAIQYLRTIGWIDPTRAAVIALDRKTRSTHRHVPIAREHMLELVRILGFDSFHTAKDRKPLTRRPWYGSYVYIKRGANRITVDGLRLFLSDVQHELDKRGRFEHWLMATTKPREFAASWGMPLTDIAAGLGVSKNQVWGHYEGRQVRSGRQVHLALEKGALLHTERARSLQQYFQGLLSSAVFYDRIQRIEHEPGSDRAFGLTVPRHQNYLAGFGACGINHNTYPLPEAQLDRFLLKLSTGYPESEQLEAEILNRRISWQRDDPSNDIKPVITGNQFRDLQRLVETKVFIHKELLIYISKLVRGLRQHPKVQVGPSPRGSLALLRASRSMALLNGRDYVSPDDVKVFVYDCLAHRTLLAVEHVLDGLTPMDVVKEVVQSVPVPTRFMESQARVA